MPEPDGLPEWERPLCEGRAEGETALPDGDDWCRAVPEMDRGGEVLLEGREELLPDTSDALTEADRRLDLEVPVPLLAWGWKP